MSWEPVIGLEIHVHLKTRTKMFCRCPVLYVDTPNTQTCPVCLAHPGALPVPNEQAIEWTIALHRDAGKMPVHVKKDVPGFVGNRLQHALWREAIALVEHGICDAETVDTVIKASFGRRLAVLGPLENADLVGTDLTLAIHRTVLPDIEHRPGPSPYLEKLVADGKLGFKSGEGFRQWTPEQQAALRAKVVQHLKKARADDA